MAVSYTNISMTGWNELSDQFNNSQLNDNFKAINEHNHTGAPKGLQIPTAGLASEAVTSEKISSEAITEAKYKNASITGSKIKTNTINYGNIMSEGLRTENYAKESITGEKLGEGTVNSAIGQSRLSWGYIEHGGTIITSTGDFTSERESAGVVKIKWKEYRLTNDYPVVATIATSVASGTYSITIGPTKETEFTVVSYHEAIPADVAFSFMAISFLYII